MLIIGTAELTDVVENVRLQSNWNNGADILTFEYPVKAGRGFPNGATVIFTYGSVNLFYGFLFTTTQSKKT